MEKLDLSNWGGQTKILGTAICVVQATFMIVQGSHDLWTTDHAVGELRLDLWGFSPCWRCLRMVSLSDL